MASFKTYYSLTKPGVMFGNAITVAAGFFLASKGHVDWLLLLAVFAGSTLAIASACVLNNVLDQDIDAKMSRTKKRAIVAGEVKARNAAVFSVALGVLGFAVLIAYTNWLVVAIGAIGYLDYVVLYGMLSKRLSIHGTLVGSISGAAPILAGYCAVSGRIDVGAILAFAALFVWQMPEFYSIAIYRRDEYAAAGIPVMPVVKGKKSTRTQILWYTVIFVIASLLLTAFGYTGYVYFVAMALLDAYWLWLAVQGLTTRHEDAWAHKMFHFSLIVLLAYSLLVSVGPVLP